MSDKKWKAGDIVRLKSGGPIMTVDVYVPARDYTGSTLDTWAVRCVWFNEYNSLGLSLLSSHGVSTIEVAEGALVAVEVKS